MPLVYLAAILAYIGPFLAVLFLGALLVEHTPLGRIFARLLHLEPK